MMSLLLGNSNGTFQPPKNYTTPGENLSAVIIPYPGGQLNIILTDPVTRGLTIYTAPGNGAIGASELRKETDTITAAAAGDFDGDGDQDLIYSAFGNLALLLRNTGSGNSPPRFPSPCRAILRELLPRISTATAVPRLSSLCATGMPLSSLAT
jgi:hypothetical protein